MTVDNNEQAENPIENNENLNTDLTSEQLPDDASNLDDADQQGETSENDDSQEDESEAEYVVTIGEESLPSDEEEQSTKAPEWVKELRKENRKKDKLIKELQAKIGGSGNATVPKLRDKPKLSDEKYDYDEDAYEADLDKWYQEKSAHDAVQNQMREAQENEIKAYQAKHHAYQEQKASIAYKDYDDVEQEVSSTLNDQQQSMIVKLSEKPTDVVYALGKRPDLLKDFSSIKDPAEFIFKLGKLETQLKVTKRKPKTAPERKVSGGGGALSTNKNLEKLREQARETKDYSLYFAAKKKLNQKG